MDHDDGWTSWAVRTVDEPPVAPTEEVPQRPSLPRAALAAGVAVAGLAGAVGAVLVLSGGGDAVTAGSTTTTPPPALAVTVPATTAPTTTPTTTAAPATTSTTRATTTTAPPTTTTTAPPVVDFDPANPIRWAVFRDGKVHLEGAIASRDLADEIVAKAGAVVGPDNVVDRYTIDPDTPRVQLAPLYVEDRILFDFGSAELRPDFYPLLELGRILLEQNPKVTITVTGHTDASGNAEFNLRLSQRRVANVIRYLTDRGVDPGRLIADPRGQSDPLVDAGDGGREARNRRVEFVIHGLLD